MSEAANFEDDPEAEVARPELVVITEMRVDELDQRIDVPHPQTGLPMTRLEALQLQETEEHGGRLITRIGEHLSESAQAVNRMLHNKNVRRGAKAGAFMIAVIAVRAGKRQYDSHYEK